MCNFLYYPALLLSQCLRASKEKLLCWFKILKAQSSNKYCRGFKKKKKKPFKTSSKTSKTSKHHMMFWMTAHLTSLPAFSGMHGPINWINQAFDVGSGWWNAAKWQLCPEVIGQLGAASVIQAGWGAWQMLDSKRMVSLVYSILSGCKSNCLTRSKALCCPLQGQKSRTLFIRHC